MKRTILLLILLGQFSLTAFSQMTEQEIIDAKVKFVNENCFNVISCLAGAQEFAEKNAVIQRIIWMIGLSVRKANKSEAEGVFAFKRAIENALKLNDSIIASNQEKEYSNASVVRNDFVYLRKKCSKRTTSLKIYNCFRSSFHNISASNE